MVCPACGAALPEGAAFCFKCGRAQPVDVPQPAPVRSAETASTPDGYVIGTECEVRFRDDGGPARLEAIVSGVQGTKIVAEETCAGRGSDEALLMARNALIVRLVNSGWSRLPGNTPDALPRFRKIAEPQNVHVDLMRRMYGGPSSAGNGIPAQPAVRHTLWTPTITAVPPSSASVLEDSATNSPRETFFVLGTLGLGAILALALPALHFNASAFLFGSASQDVSFTELAGDGFRQFGGRWTVFVAVLGVLLAAWAAFRLPSAESRLPSWLVTIGAASTLLVPIAALHTVSRLTSEGAAQGVAVSGSLSTGLILSSLAFIVAAALPWVPGLWGKR